MVFPILRRTGFPYRSGRSDNLPPSVGLAMPTSGSSTLLAKREIKTLKPLAVNVLIVPADTAADKTESVAFAGSDVAVTAQAIPGSSLLAPGKDNKVQSKPSEGIVRALGDDVKISIKEGDRVLYRSWTGLEIRIDGIDHQLTPERDVLAIVDEGEKVEVIQRPIPQPAQQQRR